MAAALISPDDVREFVPADMSATKLAAIIDDATADATRVAPCLGNLDALALDPDMRQRVDAQVRSILRAAVARRAEAGTGALTTLSQTRGPFSQAETIDTRQPSRGLLWPSEISALQDICRAVSDADSSTRLWSIDQLGATGLNHVVWCDLNMGGTTCSCGAVLTAGAGPLWERP